MKIMNIFDGDIAHSPSWKEAGLECGVRDENLQHLIEPPDNVRWVRQQYSFKEEGDMTGITIFTDRFLLPEDKNRIMSVDSPYKVAMLMESPVVTPRVYDEILELEDCFDFVFTFSKTLLDRNNKKYKYIPADWVCIEKQSHVPHEKTKMCSMIYSEKGEGDRPLRHHVAERFGKNKLNHQFQPIPNSNKIDLFGSGSPNGEEPLKSRTLNPYRFSVSMENCISDYYYTEKILDCFSTRNVPIYRGTSYISEFFDERGIITWNEMDELEEILNNLSEEKYEQMKPYIETNFELSQKYLSADDVLYELIQKCLADNNYDTKKEFTYANALTH
tara:strand:- start:126 stop:1118 length:993 start_codon:yes stop_codon:yes gene_type:complete